MVHGAGLNVLLFNTLAMGMSPDQPVYGLQAKGINGIDEPLTSIEDIAAHYISAIMAAQIPPGHTRFSRLFVWRLLSLSKMARQLAGSYRKRSKIAGHV